MGLIDRFRAGWNVFRENDKLGSPLREAPMIERRTVGGWGGHNPARARLTGGNEKSIINSMYTRLAIDVAAPELRHIRLNEKGRYKEEVKSELQYCLSLKANVDQTARQFRQVIAMTLFDKGVAAIVATDTFGEDPMTSDQYDVRSLRVGEVVDWYPQHVRVRLYNDQTGLEEEITLPKRLVCIIENPMYAFMNGHNSTLQRLIRKLILLDDIDEQISSGKIDVIFQLPYTVRGDLRKEQAETRRKDLEVQLTGSKYGVAYIDAAEKITQLNRPVENNMLKQVEYLTELLYSQLGLSKAVFDGTADEEAMLNYYNRTINPILKSITEGLTSTFLSRTAYSQGQRIRFFRDPFGLVPVSKLAEIADKFTRNEILSSNEIRGEIGFAPSEDPKADKLVNSNLNQPESGEAETVDAGELPVVNTEPSDDGGVILESILGELESKLSAIAEE